MGHAILMENTESIAQAGRVRDFDSQVS